MTFAGLVYVRLEDEVVDVWRPVAAESVHTDIYRIVDQAYDRSMERWEFEPGDRVIGEPRMGHDGPIIVAVRRVDGPVVE